MKQVTPRCATPRRSKSFQSDEGRTVHELVETLTKIQEITFAHGGHALRGVHAKSHGLLDVQVIVADGLPPQLAQGLFAYPATYPGVMRISTVPGDLLDDNVSTPRGLALKVVRRRRANVCRAPKAPRRRTW